MSDIELTYEDGLRLSELYGQLAQEQYNLNHTLAGAGGYMLLVIIVASMILIILAYCNKKKWYVSKSRMYVGHEKYEDDWRWEDWTCEKQRYGTVDWYARPSKRYRLVWNLIMPLAVIAIFAVLMYITWIGIEGWYCTNTNMHIAGIEAQIDAIESRYERYGRCGIR